MKLSYISSAIRNRRGAIGTIAVLIGMVVVGLGILVGSQIRNQHVNIAPRASEPLADPLWSSVKPINGIYPWSNGGPTAGWESYAANRVYICNGEYCWFIDKVNNQTVMGNNGNAFQMSKSSEYNTVKPYGDKYPWTNGGPTAAWTWVVPYNGQTVNETLLCNGSICWRYERSSSMSEWRDGGTPINLSQLAFWKDKPNLYTNNGPTTGWTDPVNKKATLCNGTYCESLSYDNWTWLGTVSPFPPGVTQYTSAWTSPATNIETLCTANLCYQYDIGARSFTSEPILIAAPTVTQPVDSCNSNSDCMKCGSTCINKQAELACAAVVLDFNCTCVSNKCVRVNPTATKAPAPTTTPYIVLNVRNPQGQPVTVPGLSYTYNCGSYPACFSTPAQNVSSYTINAVGTWQGGGGVALNSNQRLLGVTPNPGGGSTNSKTNNSRPTNIWFNNVIWNNYWWPKYPTTGSHSLTFIVATITPRPTNTATPRPTNTATPRPTNTATPRPTNTATPRPTNTATPRPTNTATPRPTNTATPRPTNTATPRPTNTATPRPANTTAPQATNTTAPTSTRVPTAVPTTDTCTKRSQGDANCDGTIDLADYSCIISALNNRPASNCIATDFNKSGKIDAVDYGIWWNTFSTINLLNQ